MRPEAALDQHLLQLLGLLRARLHLGKVATDLRQNFFARRFCARGVPLGVLLDNAFQRGAHEGHTRRLQRLQIHWSKKMRQARVQRIGMAVLQAFLETADPLALMGP